ncbi:HugZ family pyridoxamine 5'-phosphate oxidase [Paenibacillus spongiae]|uniref:Pyridoxamine 5'-phosphate oxidase family protein n=1 Tax=Paenibacillus spongiae TaxID=2909671 RepID=A0ABY5SAZ2_9BACL|nr:pyridoxamine 5'-phosphate oxidase family protein [Paenibacillus spongiae]UVI30695.1 pyridoxamine 5'-phosphate oxidase family protein [Paenibacillus spongiae]
MKQIDTEAMKKKFTDFVESRKTLVISSLDENGNPFASYAPFVKMDGKLYIYISRISDHYRYVEESKRISVMLLADESQSPNTFARERARWACSTANLGNEGHDEVFALFNESFGSKMMDMLRGLDFSLFELTPIEGRYVVGFGQAFDVDLSGDRFEHVVIDKKK